MSDGTLVDWDDAYAIAQKMAVCLKPLTSRLKAAGSLRRRLSRVSDIEFVLEPTVGQGGLFGTGEPEVERIRREVARWGKIEAAGDRYIRVRTTEWGVRGLKVDLFMVHRPAAWGSILAIRTGPRSLGVQAVTRMKRFGYSHKSGHAVDAETGAVVPTDTEAEFFALAKLPCAVPHMRGRLSLDIDKGRLPEWADGRHQLTQGGTDADR